MDLAAEDARKLRDDAKDQKRLEVVKKGDELLSAFEAAVKQNPTREYYSIMELGRDKPDLDKLIRPGDELTVASYIANRLHNLGYTVDAMSAGRSHVYQLIAKF